MCHTPAKPPRDVSVLSRKPALGVGGVDQSYPPALALGLGPQSWAQEPEKAGVLKAAGFAEVSKALGGGS